MKRILFATLLAAVACSPGYITYEEFGAVGDGVHDDQAAIIAAHAAANGKGLPVKAKDGATYFIGRGSETAVIKTDVDFGTARFIINDTDTEVYTASIFRVESNLEPYEVEGVEPLKKGQANLGVTLPCRSLVEVTDDARRVYIRFGPNQNDGTPQKEMLVVEKDGTIDADAPVVWDYDILLGNDDSDLEDRLRLDGFVCSVKAWPVDEKRLTVKGGTFITVANKAESKYNYRARNMVIARSNVQVEGLSHYVVGEGDHGAPYSGFLSINHACDVTVENCLLTPHRTYVTIGSAGVPVTMGSYDLESAFCVNILFKNIRQTINIDDSQYWGLFASNFCKDLRMEDCVISRFDAHMGVCNVTLTGCTFGYMGVQMVGFGTARIEDCEIHRDRLVSLRDDYGSSWDGDIIVRNSRLVIPTGRNYAWLIAGSNTGHHDFGYDCRLPLHVDIDGLYIDDSAAKEDCPGPYVYNGFNRDVSEEGLIPFPADGKITLKNITVASGKPLGISPNEKMFADAEIEL